MAPRKTSVLDFGDRVCSVRIPGAHLRNEENVPISPNIEELL
jgi:hypothetical protein